MPNFFNGRISRGTFFIGIIGSSIIAAFLGGLTQLVYQKELWLFLTFLLLLWIGLIIGVLSLLARRFHDLGKSGSLSLLYFIPIVNLVIFALLIFLKGDEKDNKFGSKPTNPFF